MTTTSPSASAIAACAAETVSHTANRAVGTPAASITVFANALDPSSCAAAADGPNTATPAAARRSARPATSGASGPITTRSAESSTASRVSPSRSDTGTGCSRASVPMPGLPGAACSSPSKRGARERPRQGVLATAGSDKEDSHRLAASLPQARRSAGSRRVPAGRDTPARAHGGRRGRAPATTGSRRSARRFGSAPITIASAPKRAASPRIRLAARRVPIDVARTRRSPAFSSASTRLADEQPLRVPLRAWSG